MSPILTDYACKEERRKIRIKIEKCAYTVYIIAYIFVQEISL